MTAGPITSADAAAIYRAYVKPGLDRTGMGYGLEDWSRLGAEIRRRRSELMVTTAELSRASNVSRSTIDEYAAGTLRNKWRPDKVRDLCLALGWTPDSFQRVLDGETPLLVDRDD
jgi:Helix-turn-helix domain